MNSGVKVQSRKVLSELIYFLVRFTKRLFLMQDGTCRFEPTCSQYSREAIRHLPIHKAIPKIIHRISRCRPGGGFGSDPVIPEKFKQEFNQEEK